MPNFDFKVDKSKKTDTGNTVRFYDDGLEYIRYCIMKETGEEISISILRLAFKYFVEFVIYQMINDKTLGFLNFGTFYTKWYPECIKRNKKGEKIYIPTFPYPSLNFSKTVRNALKIGSFPFFSPEFLNAPRKHFKGLFHAIRIRDYDEFNLEEPPEEKNLEVSFYSDLPDISDRIKIDL